jgi:putative two-component system response regulator
VDVFDALTHDRVYRPAMSLERALEIIRAGRAAHFDPAVVDAFLETLDDLLALHAPSSRRPAAVL